MTDDENLSVQLKGVYEKDCPENTILRYSTCSDLKRNGKYVYCEYDEGNIVVAVTNGFGKAAFCGS